MFVDGNLGECNVTMRSGSVSRREFLHARFGVGGELDLAVARESVQAFRYSFAFCFSKPVKPNGSIDANTKKH